MKFGAFDFDPVSGKLRRAGETVAVGHRGSALLKALTQRWGEVVSKDELIEAAWPGQAVEESNLTVQVAALRKAIGLTEAGIDWITTVPRVGYRFVGDDGEANGFASKPIICVLPFENVSSDPDQEFFAQGLAEDLITDLSHVPGLMVIARNSSFAMRERRRDIRWIANELGAGFVVDGSVRRAANRVRINVQLIEAGDQSPLWAERFDGDLNDVFSLQDQVVGRIVGALQRVLSIGSAPRERRTVDIEAYDCFLRGRSLALTSTDGYRLGHPLLERATQIDPNFAEAFAWLALSHVHAFLNWGEPYEEHYAAAVAAAERANSLDSDNADALTFQGYIKMIDGRLDDALTLLDRAIELDANHADTFMFKAEVLVHMGRPEDAIDVAQDGLKLNPVPPLWYRWSVAFAQYAARLDEAVIATLDREDMRLHASRRLAAASYANLGRMKDARRAAAEFLTVVPHFSIRDWSAGQPFIRPSDREHYIQGFRSAGLPD